MNFLTLTVWGPFHRKYFKWKKICGYRLISEKMEVLYDELKERVEAATGSYFATGDSLKYIFSVPVTKNHQNIPSRCLVHEFSFTDFFKDINHVYSGSILYGCGYLFLLWGCWFFFFDWDSLHARLKSHYETWSYKKRSTKKITGYRKSV